MKVQVTPHQLIETDDIVFAEQDNKDPEATLVWLRSMRGANVKVYLDYESFVSTLNRASGKHFGQVVTLP